MDRPSLLQPIYKYIYDWFGGNDALISMTVSYLLLVGVFWLTGAFFLIADVTGRPKWMLSYKVQKGANIPIDRAKLKKALKTIMFNNLILNALFSYPIYRQQVHVGCSFAVDDTPRWPTILRDLAICTIIQEIVFYYSHRLLHHPWLYASIHKKHHQWTAPIGIVAIYASPVEYLTGNGLSVVLGPLITRSHIVIWWIWLSLAMIVTIVHHSGYHLPCLPSPQFHDYHHLTYNWNFGTLGILDWLHGTDAGFRKTVQRKRHRMFWNATPIHRLYPDQKKQNGAPQQEIQNGKPKLQSTSNDREKTT